MIAIPLARRALALGGCVMLVGTGCAYNGVNSLPLPGTVGRGPRAHTYHIEIANVAMLEPNSPVMINDVVVGTVGAMTVHGWHADVEVSVKPDAVVPANVVASIGQTSLLGSMHLELGPPPGQPGKGNLQSGATIPLNRSSTYPSTEKTLSALSVVINAGGFSQIGDLIHNFNAAISGHAGDIRDLLVRLDRFVGTFDRQHDDLIASLRELNRLAGTFAGQTDVITRGLREIPRALDVLIQERPRIIAALDKLRVFSDTATRLVNDAGSDLVKDLKNVEPALRSLADVGPNLDQAIALAPTFPFPQNLIDRGIRGDYANEFVTIDLTNASLRKTLLLGTHWGREGAEFAPAPGDPSYLQYQYTPDPLHPAAPGPVAPPAGAPLTPTAAPAPSPAVPLPLPPPGAPPPVPPPPPPVPGVGQGPVPPYASPTMNGSG
jgi:virulence factor Mce-like protein